MRIKFRGWVTSAMVLSRSVSFCWNILLRALFKFTRILIFFYRNGPFKAMPPWPNTVLHQDFVIAIKTCNETIVQTFYFTKIYNVLLSFRCSVVISSNALYLFFNKLLLHGSNGNSCNGTWLKLRYFCFELSLIPRWL